jgi:hypothetical protein
MQWTCFCCRWVTDGDGASQDGMDGWTDGKRGGDRHIDTERDIPLGRIVLGRSTSRWLPARLLDRGA